MHTIEIEIPDELAQRLAPYHDQLPALLEAGLQVWHEELATTPVQMPAALLARQQALLDKQNTGTSLTFEEQQEVEALAALAQRVSLKRALVERIHAVLAASGRVHLPKPYTGAKPYVRHTPVPITGQPVSEIVIEQRGPR
jgi:hypothetical protein